MPKFIILDTDLLIDGQYFRQGCPIELTNEKAALLSPYLQQIIPVEVDSADELPDGETMRKMQDGQIPNPSQARFSQNSESSKKGKNK